MPSPVRSPVCFSVSAEIMRIGRALQAAGGRPLVVGGWVRDRLLGLPETKDWDIEVFGLSMQALQRVLRPFGRTSSVGRQFGVLKLHTRAGEYDFSIPRREGATGRGHRDFWVRWEPQLGYAEAAARRDFRLNSMGYAFLEDRLLDPYRGERDLCVGVLRHVGPAFREDPLRVLRAMRFAGCLGLLIDSETVALCRTLALDALPRERIWEELRRLLLQARRPSLGLAYADALGVLRLWPELAALQAQPTPPGMLSAWEASLSAVDALATQTLPAPSDPLLAKTPDALRLSLLCAAWMHRLGKAAHTRVAAAKRLLAQLSGETQLREDVCRLLDTLDEPQRLYAQRTNLPPGALPRLALRAPLAVLMRLFAAVQQAQSIAPAAIAKPDTPSSYLPSPGASPCTDSCDTEAVSRWIEQAAREAGVWFAPPRPILQGRQLLAWKLPAGPAMGCWLQHAFQAQLDGHFHSAVDGEAWLRAQGFPESAPPLPLKPRTLFK